MPTKPLSREVAEQAVKAVETELRQGFRPAGLAGNGPGAIAQAAKTLNVPPGTIQGRLRAALLHYGLEPDESLYRDQRYHQPASRSVIQTHESPPLMRPTGRSERILSIGDLHQCPRHEDRLAVLTMIARHASEVGYERIIQIGDWSTWDSVSAHDRNETHKGRLKPSIRQDMDNLVSSHRAFRAGMAPGYKPKLIFLQGNHENRLERFENAHPEAYGTHTLERDQIFIQFGWQIRPYGEIYYCEGVGFTHHPINGAGRAFGGKTGPQRAANDSTIPLVSGHTHRRQVHDSPKIGPVQSISMIEIGCAMPWGTVEAYAAHSATGWWWGVVDMTVQQGSITDVSFMSMLTLEERYGNRLAA